MPEGTKPRCRLAFIRLLELLRIKKLFISWTREGSLERDVDNLEVIQFKFTGPEMRCLNNSLRVEMTCSESCEKLESSLTLPSFSVTHLPTPPSQSLAFTSPSMPCRHNLRHLNSRLRVILTGKFLESQEFHRVPFLNCR